MKEINLKFDLTRPRNAEHYQLHSDMLRVISADFASRQGIASLREKYQALFNAENDCYLQNRTYQNTAEIEAADKKRDEIFLYISQTITTGKLCPIEIKRKAAIQLDYVLSPYRDAPRLNYASNTAAVTDFVEKISEPQYKEALTTLSLAECVTALDEANLLFLALYAGRSSEVLSRSTTENMKMIRPKVDTAYREIASAINALYQVNALITKDNAKEQAVGAVIDQANALIIQLQKTLSKAGVGAKPTFKPGDGNTPSASEPGSDSESPDEI